MDTRSRNFRGGMLIVAVVAGVWGMSKITGSTMSSGDADPFSYGERADADSPPDRDLFDMGVAISGTKAGLTYEEWDEKRDAENVDNYEGFGCIESCAGHIEGYHWAEQNNISLDECSGNSWSFVEGCAAFASKNAEPSIEEGPELGL